MDNQLARGWTTSWPAKVFRNGREMWQSQVVNGFFVHKAETLDKKRGQPAGLETAKRWTTS